MITNNKCNIFIPLGLVFAIVISLALVPLVGNSSLYIKPGKGMRMAYETRLFQEGKLVDLEIAIDPDEWNKLLEHAADKEYTSCDVTINGELMPNVGVRAKGGSSLDDVKLYFNGKRYSLMLKFDKFENGQTYHGLDKLALNNCIYDKTAMKDAITYDMSRTIGLAAPLYNYAKVSMNGLYWGCFLAVEPVSDSFLRRNFGSNDGVVYEPFGALTYKGEDPSLYTGMTEDIVTGKKDARSTERIVAASKSVHTGKDIQKHVDVDNILKFLAIQTMAVHFDGLVGKDPHNYYLYDDGNCIRLLPWDYNLAYGGYPGVLDDTTLPEELGNMDEMSEEEQMAAWETYFNSLSKEEQEKLQQSLFDNTKEANLYVNFPIDTPFIGDLSDRTFFMKLLENKTYRDRYHQYLEMLAHRYIKGGKLDKTMAVISQEIGDIMGTELYAFYSNKEFTKSLHPFRKLLDLKADAVQKQLNGQLPSTWDTQAAAPEKIIDASRIDLKQIGVGN